MPQGAPPPADNAERAILGKSSYTLGRVFTVAFGTALVVLAVLLAGAAVLDPTFVSLAVLAGRDGTFWSAWCLRSCPQGAN